MIQRKGDDAEMCSDKFMRRLLRYLRKIGWTEAEIVQLLEYVTEK